MSPTNIKLYVVVIVTKGIRKFLQQQKTLAGKLQDHHPLKIQLYQDPLLPFPLRAIILEDLKPDREWSMESQAVAQRRVVTAMLTPERQDSGKGNNKWGSCYRGDK